METLIVYDSFFGNTEQIARMVAGAIDGSKALRVSKVKPPDMESIDLLIVGSPTRGFMASEAIQVFIKDIPDNTLKGMKVTAFDTRLPAGEVGKGLRLLMKVGGYAAPRIVQVLKKKGGTLIAPPEGFFVKDREGPLKEGELERAASWANGIVK